LLILTFSRSSAPWASFPLLDVGRHIETVTVFEPAPFQMMAALAATAPAALSPAES
jgi:hypothetical protein